MSDFMGMDRLPLMFIDAVLDTLDVLGIIPVGRACGLGYHGGSCGWRIAHDIR